MAGPIPNMQTRGAGSFGAGLHIGNGVWIISGDAAPSDGTSGTGAGYAGPGSMYLRTATGKAYLNAGTKASPVWKLVTSAS